MKKQILAALAIISVGIIGGCGSSTGNNPTTSISGKVADGYLVGATVFLDKNNNYQLDVDEPHTTTDSTGAYTLNINPADVGKYPIVALAIKDTTVDMDTRLPIQKSYVLSMHAVSVNSSAPGIVAGSVSNFISPMSSQLREMMETGKYATMQKAKEDLQVKLGMPAGTDMLADYMAVNSANNTTMHTAAQNMASLMGGQMAQVFVPNGLGTSVDVNRYRGMMGTIFSNISSIKGANAQPAMANLMNSMTSALGTMP